MNKTQAIRWLIEHRRADVPLQAVIHRAVDNCRTPKGLSTEGWIGLLSIAGEYSARFQLSVPEIQSIQADPSTRALGSAPR